MEKPTRGFPCTILSLALKQNGGNADAVMVG